MNKQDLVVGDVVQLNPDTCKNSMFGACMMTITEPKDWGAQGYIQLPDGQAYYRATWEEMELVGKAIWSVV